MNFLRRYRYIIFTLTLGVFIVGMFVGFGSYFYTAGPVDLVAKVNGERITYQSLQQTVSRQTQQLPRDTKPEQLVELEDRILQTLIQRILFHQEFERMGIRVPDSHLSAWIQSIPEFRENNQFSPLRYRQVLQYSLRMSPQQFESNERQKLELTYALARLRGVLATPEAALKSEWQTFRTGAGSNPNFPKTLDQFESAYSAEQSDWLMNGWIQQLSLHSNITNRLPEIRANSGVLTNANTCRGRSSVGR